MIGKPFHCLTQVAPPPNMHAIDWEYILRNQYVDNVRNIILENYTLNMTFIVTNSYCLAQY